MLKIDMDTIIVTVVMWKHKRTTQAWIVCGTYVDMCLGMFTLL